MLNRILVSGRQSAATTVRRLTASAATPCVSSYGRTLITSAATCSRFADHVLVARSDTAATNTSSTQQQRRHFSDGRELTLRDIHHLGRGHDSQTHRGHDRSKPTRLSAVEWEVFETAQRDGYLTERARSRKNLATLYDMYCSVRRIPCVRLRRGFGCDEISVDCAHAKGTPTVHKAALNALWPSLHGAFPFLSSKMLELQDGDKTLSQLHKQQHEEEQREMAAASKAVHDDNVARHSHEHAVSHNQDTMLADDAHSHAHYLHDVDNAAVDADAAAFADAAAKHGGVEQQHELHEPSSGEAADAWVDPDAPDVCVAWNGQGESPYVLHFVPPTLARNMAKHVVKALAIPQPHERKMIRR